MIISLLTDSGIIAPIVFILLRVTSIVIPPIPGLSIDIIGIAYFGWFPAFIYAFIATLIGVMIAFWLARKFREPLVSKFVSLKKMMEWEKTLSEREEFWGFVILRFFTSPVFDFISYMAGLTRINAWKFLLATIIANTPLLFTIYYFGGLIFDKSIYYIGLFILVLFVIWYMSKKYIQRA